MYVPMFICGAVFACLGFLSPANRGSLMTCVLVLYVCLGTPAGYVSARIYKSELTTLNIIIITGFFSVCVSQEGYSASK